MRIAHVSTFDQTGGAAKAMLRLHRGLLEAGVDSQIYCSVKSNDAPNCHQLQWDESLPAKLKRKAFKLAHPEPATRPGTGLFFSQDRSWTGAQALPQLDCFDLLHLHWIAALPEHHIPAPVDLASLAKQLPIDVPVLWTLHDMAPFTGGCHYTVDCDHFQKACGHCPQLAQPGEHDNSRRIWQRKQAVYQKMDTRLTLHATSRYMAEMAAGSSLMQAADITRIPLGVDTGIYYPRDRQTMREKHGIAQEAVVVLFVSDSLNNPLKGMGLLADALSKLDQTDQLLLLSVGCDKPTASFTAPARHLGQLKESDLAEIYALADIFAFPSTQEAFGQTPLEAMASGCAVAACPSGAVPDIMEHGEHGLVASGISSDALAMCIQKLIQNESLRKSLGAAACARVEREFTLATMTDAMIGLYRELTAA